MIEAAHPVLTLSEARKWEKAASGHLPGDPSMWFFVVGDLWIFTAYFACYIFDRMHNHDLFLQAQQHLNQGVGATNTLILLTSSLFVALGVKAARSGCILYATRFIGLGAACGLAFAVVKLLEWYPKIAAGITPGTNAFFMYYYMLAGLHLFHVMLGLAVLAILLRELRVSKQPRVELMETGATYWHMVDLLWIVLFALLYVMR